MVMKKLMLSFAVAMSLSISAFASSIAPASEGGFAADSCVCESWVDETNEHWTFYVKNASDSDVVIDVWYVVEMSDGTKDTRTNSFHIHGGGSTYVDTDLIRNSHCIEYGCECRMKP